MSTNWRLSTVSGTLVAAYLIPVWTIAAFRIMVSPIHGLFDRAHIALGIFMSDHVQLAAMGTVRIAWLLALAKLTTVAFLALFLVLVISRSARNARACDEPLAIGLIIATIISFGGMVLASKVGEMAALRLHATELLLLLGTGIVMLVEAPAPSAQPQQQREDAAAESYPVGNPSS